LISNPPCIEVGEDSAQVRQFYAAQSLLQKYYGIEPEGGSPYRKTERKIFRSITEVLEERRTCDDAPSRACDRCGGTTMQFQRSTSSFSEAKHRSVATDAMRPGSFVGLMGRKYREFHDAEEGPLSLVDIGQVVQVGPYLRGLGARRLVRALTGAKAQQCWWYDEGALTEASCPAAAGGVQLPSLLSPGASPHGGASKRVSSFGFGGSEVIGIDPVEQGGGAKEPEPEALQEEPPEIREMIDEDFRKLSAAIRWVLEKAPARGEEANLSSGAQQLNKAVFSHLPDLENASAALEDVATLQEEINVSRRDALFFEKKYNSLVSEHESKYQSFVAELVQARHKHIDMCSAHSTALEDVAKLQEEINVSRSKHTEELANIRAECDFLAALLADKAAQEPGGVPLEKAFGQHSTSGQRGATGRCALDD
jgi:hypothetical protein